MAADYTTIQGDTFDVIAYRLFKNGHYCGEIMRANPDEMDAIFFEPGQGVKIPEISIRPEKGSLPPWYEE